jgi:hypothetical protein
MTHPDVPAEQAHVDLAYARLAAMRAAAEARLHDAFGERGGTFQAVTERDIRVRNSLNRLEQLEIGSESLVFGRIDRAAGGGQLALPLSAPPPPPAAAAPAAANGDRMADESFHIGRLAISDEDQEPLVVDWRAPIAEPFYRATGAHPMGLTRRRHFLTEGHQVLDLEDELFDSEGAETGVGLGLSGPQVLLATLERSRTGRMRDIVATVQREQDEIIRGPLPGILVVQGGPGTGKTAVALHRAAYLLYTHRFPLEGQGVLVVGPNPTFLRYIEHVLPSLDESGVDLSTVNGLYPGNRATAHEGDDVALLKGDARMARFIARAVSDRQRPLRRAAEIPFGPKVLRITPEVSAQVVNAARRRPGSHNARRRTVETLLWRYLLEQATTPADAGRDREVDTLDESLTAAELGRNLRRQPEMIATLERMWPVLTPEQLLHDLLGAPPLIELAAARLLTPAECALLRRPRAGGPDQVAWSAGDIPLLDEARFLLGPATRRSIPDIVDHPRTFGHVVVDEAQDLSPMQLRMVARRSLSGSMTVVGDIAQATGTWVPASWAQVVDHLPARKGWRLVELTVNYRTPTEIMEMAGRILDQVAPGMRPPEAVRSSGAWPRVLRVSPGEGAFPGDALGSAAAEAARRQLEMGAGTLGVIVPPSLVTAVERALAQVGVGFGTVGDGALDERVTLLTVEDAKGLEFDTVTVVEPARIAAEAPQGLRALYVAFTRATQRLEIVHDEPLPAAVGVAAPSSA